MVKKGKKKKKKKSRKNNNVSLPARIIIGIISLILAFTIFSLVSAFITLFKIGNTSMPRGSSSPSGEPVNILILGMDIGDPTQVNNNSIKRTDTIMVLNYNPETKKMQIVSVPRDTLIKNNNYNMKINSAFAVGGYPKIKNEVQKILNININYMVKIDYNAFVEIIDALGGIDMKIERNMIYDDEGQNLHINFKAGETVNLNGKKAEEFFRWRKNNDGSGFANGDLDRIQNQHKFIEKVVEKVKSPFILFRLPEILSAIADNVETNIPPSELMMYGFKIINIDKQDISMSTVIGNPKMISGQSYLVFDKSLNKTLLSSLKSGISYKSGIGVTSKDDIKIKILNATKINGLAGSLKKELNSIGYTRIDTGNTELLDESVILCDDEGTLDMITGEVSISKTDTKKNLQDSDKQYEVVIILGKDYKKFGE